MSPRDPGERQQKVAEFVLARGKATAQDLAAAFHVSLMTMHRDLDELARQGIVRKYRGGVTAQPSGVFESNVAYRRKSMAEEKRRVAKRAASYVEPGMSVLLDDATTSSSMIPLLAELTPLRVATNYLDALRELSQVRGIQLMALGGDYDPLHDSFLGLTCVECVESIRVDAAFLSTSAVSGGLAYHQEERIVLVKRAMIGVAAKAYLLLDHSKLGRVALHRLAPLSDFDLLVVDGDASPGQLADLAQHQIPYEVA